MGKLRPKRKQCSGRGIGRAPAWCGGSPPCHSGLAISIRPAGPSASCSPRLTAQWSVEDKEEAAPEQCRHERDRQLQAQDEDGGRHVPEQPEQEMLPGPHASDEGHLEELSQSKEGPDPEDTVQDNLGAAGAKEEQEHRKCQQPRTPSPLVLEGTTEHSPPPPSPTTKVGQLIDRTESLHRSIEKSNSVKKSQPDLPISRIDQWLEQYTQAIQTSGQTPRLARQASIELPSMAVASTKSLWETGEVQAQSAAKTPPCKDIVAGDMSKKSLWEQKGGSKTSSTIKSTPSGKRYKFVATGHGKYEKVLVEGGPAP
uniref:lymphocyte-specific protein 1 isoform X8 n=1 Tax=Callithrix jacchus TaxID=9483 RepID=UPI00159DE2E5|nr:lymphocyte-specific protein 1 isoform X8 [Callithrix jacchus]